jgi:hypothetical protein
MIEWFNDNAGAVQAASTLVLVGVTIVYVYLTRNIASAARSSVRETRELVKTSREQADAAHVMAAEATRARSLGALPIVVAEYAGGSTPNKINVKAKNHGVGTATALQIRLVLEFDEQTKETPQFLLALALAPDEEIKRAIHIEPFLADAIIRQSQHPSFECTYRDALGAEFRTFTTKEAFNIDGENETGKFALGTDSS